MLGSAANATELARYASRGRAPIEIFSAAETGGGWLNYRVLALPDGRMGASNDQGLLSFDGERWRLHAHPDARTGLVALAATPEGRLCGGFMDDPGCFVPTGKGDYDWQSALARTDGLGGGLGRCLNALYDPQRNGVWYVYTRRLLFIPDRPDAVPLSIEHAEGVSGSAWHDGRLWVASVSKRLMATTQDFANEAPRLEAIDTVGEINATLKGVVGGAEGETLILLMSGQLLALRDDTVSPVAETHWPQWRKQTPMSILPLRDGHYAIGFLRGPLQIIDREGRLRERYGEAEGLPEDVMHGLLEDAEGSLWVAYSGGLARIERSLASSSFGREHGLGATGQMVEWQGSLYVTSRLGLHRFVPADEGPRWERFQPELAALVSHASVIGDELWLAGSRLLRFETAQRGEIVLSKPGSIYPAPAHSDRAYVLSGALGFEWRLGVSPAAQELLPVPTGSIARVVEEDRDTVWTVMHSAGLVRHRRTAVPGEWSSERFAVDQGLPAGALVLAPAPPHAAQATLWAGSSAGLRRMAADRTRFEDVPALPEALRREAIQSLYQDVDGQLWLSTPLRRGVARWLDGDWQWDERPLAAVDRAAAIHAFHRQGNVLWVMHDAGLTRIELDHQRLEESTVRPRIVELVDLDRQQPQLLQTEEARALRNLRVQFAWPLLHGRDGVEWRSRLVGLDSDYDTWSRRSSREWTQLPAGDFVLQAEARNRQGRVLAIEPLHLHNPLGWYQRPWAYAVYVLLAAISLLLAARLGARHRQQRLLQRQAELEATVQLRTQELKDSNDALQRQAAQLALQAEQLQAIDQLKTQFFINVGHEFRTPLSLVLGPLEDLLRDARERMSERVRSQLEMALRNARRVLDLIVELLDVNRLQQGQMHLRPDTHDLRHFLRHLAEECVPLAARYGQVLQTDLGGHEPAPCDFDALLIERALGNLIANAAKYSPRGTLILLSLRREDSGYAIAVLDQGRGIAPEALPHVFDRFFQVDGNDRASGYGIGLSLVREIAQAHGGKVSVTSELGVGSCFVLHLPALGRHTDAVIPSSHSATPAAVDEPVIDSALPIAACVGESPTSALASGTTSGDLPGRARVLVIDDHEDLRRRVGDLLAPHFEVLEAADGDSAWHMARKELPDLVVSDVMMPGCDGVTLTRRLRTHPDTEAIGILLLTAKVGSEHAVAGLQAGANDYLAKPFDSSELLARCDAILAHARRLQHRMAARAASIPETPPDSAEDRWRQRLDQHIAAHLHDSTFGIEALARCMYADRSQLFRKCKDILGQSPSDYLRDTRLAHGHRLLEHAAGNVSEVAYASGFDNLSSFTRAFKTRYGIPPSQVRGRAA